MINKIYIDTEFTDLVKDNKLISIALINEAGDSLYIVLTDTWQLSDCSQFVKDIVLPILNASPENMLTKAEAGARICEWLESQGDEVVIYSDAPGWDIPHLKALVGEFPRNVRNLWGLVQFSAIDKIEVYSIYDECGFKEHNAEHDAYVNMIIDKRRNR